jgi:hypothetical protein
LKKITTNEFEIESITELAALLITSNGNDDDKSTKLDINSEHLDETEAFILVNI